METLGSHITKIISDLIQANRFEAKKPQIYDSFKLLSTGWSNYPLRLRPQRKFTTICWDGTPIEFSVSISDKSREMIRYVTEVLDTAHSIKGNIMLSRKITPALMKILLLKYDAEKLVQLHNTFFPEAVRLPNKLGFGIWHGVAISSQESCLKLYFNTKWRDQKEVIKLCNYWLSKNYNIKFDKVIVDSGIVRSFLYSHSELVSVGIEFGQYDIHSIKLYYRIVSAISTGELEKILSLVAGLTGRAKLNFAHFDEVVFNGPRHYIPRSLILSIKIPLNGRAISPTVKVEAAINSYQRSDSAIRSTLCEIITSFGYDATSYDRTYDIISNVNAVGFDNRKRYYHSMAGIGLTKDTDCASINVYLKPDVW